MKIKNLFLALIVLGSSTALADTPKPDKLSTADLAVIGHLHAVDQEIKLGKLAQSNSSTAGVKAFGETLVADHTATDKELAELAKKRGAVIPNDVPKTDDDKRAQQEDLADIAKLKTLRGAEFDRKFLAMMISGHESEIDKLDTAIGATTDPDVKTLLTNVKPVLQGHETAARQLASNTPQAAK